MTSFGWKKKVGAKVSRTASQAFEKKAKDETDEAVEAGEVDWLTLAPQKRAMMLEDAQVKSHRLKDEGATLAESERYWEALRKWDQALQLTPNDEKLMEMKAQVYLTLNEVYPAVQAAEKTVEMNPLWWVGHQTLGRARLGLGEVRLAVKCFSRAIHINPAVQELWQDDMFWTIDLLHKKKQLEQEAIAAAEAADQMKSAEIVELNEESTSQEAQITATKDNTIIKYNSYDDKNSHSRTDTESGHSPTDHAKTIGRLPKNYIAMRN